MELLLRSGRTAHIGASRTFKLARLGCSHAAARPAFSWRGEAVIIGYNNIPQKRAYFHDSSFPSISRLMPAETWDTHMHVTSADYPLAPDAAYKPSSHTLQDAMKFEKTINISNIVLVQPSIYGNDNSCLLDALKAVGSRRGRGVVGFNPNTIDSDTLEEWHRLGVRGVRVNLKSTNVQFTKASLEKTLHSYARVIKPFDWVLELFIGMEAIPMLESIVPTLEVKVCIAHFGMPKLPASGERVLSDPYEIPGFKPLVSLLQGGHTWVKFSGPYLFDKDPDMRGVEVLAKELLGTAHDRIVFASNWPHTRFDGIDVRPFVEKCLDWAEDRGVTDRVFSLNAKELWDA